MALISPGVQVTIIDESQYLAAPTNSVPFILISTAQNKSTPSGDGVAIGTTPANANKVFLITSQRDLVNTFGSPFFYRTSAGTPLHGYELNEHGLLAAYSVLGVSNRAYVMRTDVDLAALTARVSRPRGTPVDQSYWLDTSETRWGIFQWNSAAGQFDVQSPIVITNTNNLDSMGLPLESIGSIGSYAVVATNVHNPVYYKNSSNEWVLVGSDEWMESHAAVTGTQPNPFVTTGNVISINGYSVTITGTSATAVRDSINMVGIPGVLARLVNNRVALFVNSSASSDSSSQDGAVSIQNVVGNTLDEIGIIPGVYYGPAIQQSVHSVFPRWRTTDAEPRPTGSVWNKLTEVNLGVDFSIKRYDTLTNLWNRQSIRVAQSDADANRQLNPAGGGLTIAVGTVYAQYDSLGDNTATFRFFRRIRSGQTIIQGQWANPMFNVGDQFTVSASTRTSTSMSDPVVVTLSGTSPAAFVSALLAQNVENVTARVTEIGTIEITHTQGGVIALKDVNGTAIVTAGFLPSVAGIREGNDDDVILSNWQQLNYDALIAPPGQKPVNNTHWYYSTITEPDIMMHDGNGWRGYRMVSNDVRGFNLTQTDPNGPQVAAIAPQSQRDGVPLAYGDLWIDSSDLENYPALYRWEDIEGIDQWVRVNNSDQTTQNGIVFADARWAPNGNIDPIEDPIPVIPGLLLSDYVDIDAPDPSFYPAGTLLFNTRRSGFNVKQFKRNYFNAVDFPDSSLPTAKDAWISVSRLKSDGSPNMGRTAVRSIIVAALKASIDTSTELREEQRQYNLISTPGYPELLPNMVALNNERNNTAFIVGDTPIRLRDSGNAIMSWANDGGEDNLTVGDPYAGVFYPAALTTDLTGNPVVQPASHMLLRTIIRSDERSYPWFAPAGQRRGTIDNAQSIGYIDAATGEFVQVANRESIRDVLYSNRINPITFMPGAGLLNYGNKTLLGGDGFSSAMDRINVARLVAYLRNRLEAIGRMYLFEPNDQITRNEVKNDIERLMNEMIANRGIYDYLVVCDESNNTPARIDRNELHIDIAIEPVKAVEFVYIPVRLKNTGTIGNLT